MPMETMESPNQPTTIMNNSLIPLSHAVQIIKTAILQSQEQSAKKVNADLLALYYAIGWRITTTRFTSDFYSNTFR